MREENPAVTFDQWSNFVIWAIGLWFAEQTTSKFSGDKNETNQEKE